MNRMVLRFGAIAGAAVMSMASLSGCAPLLIGGAMVGGSLVALDRRTSGTQLEDQSIELKARKSAYDATGNRGNLSVTSYNRLVLLTGEAETEADRRAAEQAVARTENVARVVNELSVQPGASARSRSNDLLLTSKVKATLVDARDLQANAFKVTTERGIVYLMGIVTEREATRATALTSSIAGVQKVVRVFEIVSEQELARQQTRASSPSSSSAPAPSTAAAPAPVEAEGASTSGIR